MPIVSGTENITSILPGVGIAPTVNKNGIILDSSTDGLTATPSGTQANSLLLAAKMNRVTVIATTGDSVLLPPAKAGETIIVYNGHASNALGVFPASATQGGVTGGDAINALGVNAVYSVTAAFTATFRCVTTGQWYAQKAALS